MSAPIIIKYGGSLLDDAAHRDAFLKDIAELSRKYRVILVHGGGKEISRQMEKAGLVPRFVNGRRFTDDATLAVVEKALQTLNADIVHRLTDFGAPAAGYSGRHEHLVQADAVAELGRVGLPKKVDAAVFQEILSRPALPVFYSVAEDATHRPLNINADDFALALATAIGAIRLVYLTDTGGLLDGAGKLIGMIYDDELEPLITKGIITGGMVVKVRACVDALRHRVGRVDLEKDVKFLLAGKDVSSGTTLRLRSP